MGQTLSASYPDYIAVVGSGVVQDRQGRVAAGRTDMDGSDNGLLTTALSGVNGVALGANGGGQTVDIIQTDLPNIVLPITIAAGQGTHFHGPGSGLTNYIGDGGGGVRIVASGAGTNGAATNTGSATLPSMTGTSPLNGGVTQTHLNKVQPTMITNMIVVVE